MGKYVTPRGVEVEASDAAALAVGYKPVDEPKSTEGKPAQRSAKSAKSSKSSK